MASPQTQGEDSPLTLPQHGFITRLILQVTHLVIKYPIVVMLLVVCSAIMASVYTARQIEFKTDRSDLIDPQAEFHRRWLNYAESFGASSDIIIVVETPSQAQQHQDQPSLTDQQESNSHAPILKEAVDELARRIKQEPEFFTNVFHRVELGNLKQKGLYYLSPEQLQAGLNMLKNYSPVIQGRWELVSIPMLTERLLVGFRSGTNATQAGLWDQAVILSRSLEVWSRQQGEFVSPWLQMISVDPKMHDMGRQVQYLFNESGTMGFIQLTPVAKSSFSGSAPSIKRLREIVTEVEYLLPQVKIGLTGIPVLESDEMTQSQQDMTWASVASFASVAIILFLGFRSFKYPLLALIMLAIGMAWSFGFTTASIGHLNILSISFAAILIGLGIDFAIHYLASYLELRQGNQSLEKSLLKTSSNVGLGILTSGVTTAMAFYCATLTDFLAIAELGLIAAGGIILCMVANFIVTPALVTLADKGTKSSQLPGTLPVKGLQYLLHQQPHLVLGISLVIMVLLILPGWSLNKWTITPNISYDSNLLNLQAHNVESVAVQERIFAESKGSLLYAVSVAKSPQEARELKAKFEALPTVLHVKEIASNFPAFTPEETKLFVQGYRALLAHLPDQLPEPTLQNPQLIGTVIERLYALAQQQNHPAAQEVTMNLDRFLARYEQLTLEQQIKTVTAYQARLQYALLMQFKHVYGAAGPEPISLADFPSELTSRFVSKKGEWLVQIFPKEQIWDKEPLAKFVHDVRTVDPEVTGTPLQNYEASLQIQNSYLKAAIYSLVVIILVLLMDFMKNNHVALVFIPTALVTMLVVGILNQQDFNISLEMILGIVFTCVMVLALMLDRQSICESLLSLSPPVLGTLMMVGILVMLGIDFNPANMIVLPLILGIGVDNGVHVLHNYRKQLETYKISASTVSAASMTALTTVVGFASMIPASHRGLSSLGIVLSLGVICSLFVSLIPLPALLTLMDKRQSIKPTEIGTPANQQAA